ncbi:hypothetical protein L484_021856 [Morus notabilis]|uniref:Flavin-containing monooxygenase n=1 Tax=Morus notabilis TaxID=981085 RepID=W9QSR9_9ROSA|nr:hypothetical protein L484_021856 [Morus notabilis]
MINLIIFTQYEDKALISSQVFPSITNIEGNKIKFENGKIKRFDAIIFATGYRSTIKNWLKDEETKGLMILECQKQDSLIIGKGRMVFVVLDLGVEDC